MSGRKIVTAAASLGLLAAGCSGAEAAPCEPQGDTMPVDETCVEDWPLTVSEATLHCEGDAQTPAPMVEADGTTYALTGFGQQMGGEPLEPDDEVWADNPSTGAKVNVSELADLARTLC